MTAAVISLFAFSCTKEPNKPVNPDNPENPDNPDTPTELKLTFNISDIEYTDAAITIKSNMSDTSFVYFVTEAKEFESIKDNDERFEKDMDILNELSLQLGYISFEEYVFDRRFFTEEASFKASQVAKLSPGTEYYVYAYIMTKDNLKKYTNFFSDKFTTTELEMVDCKFDVKSQVDGNRVTVDISPSIKDVAYYCNIFQKEKYEEIGGDPLKALEYDLDMIIKYAEQNGVSKEEILDAVCSVGDQKKMYAALLEGREYVFYIGAVDKSGFVYSEAQEFRFTTDNYVPSSNTFKVDITDIQLTTAYVNITTGNFDTYTWLPQEVSKYDGMTDEQIMEAYIKEYTDALTIGLGLYNGDSENTVAQLTPDTEYYILAFGYEGNMDGGKATTALTKVKFRTLPEGDAQQTKFEISAKKTGSRSIEVSITPSNDNVIYLYGALPENEYKKMGGNKDAIYQYVEAQINDYISRGGTAADFVEQLGAMGKIENSPIENLLTGYSYVAYAIPAKSDGSLVNNASVSAPVTTDKAQWTNIKSEIKIDKYFDGSELAIINNKYEDAYGYVVVPAFISSERPAAHNYFAVYPGDITGYDDNVILNNVLTTGKKDQTRNDIYLQWNQQFTFVCIAEDADGNFGEVFTKVMTFTKEGASPVDEFPE